jgi:hypothetical protein
MISAFGLIIILLHLAVMLHCVNAMRIALHAFRRSHSLHQCGTMKSDLVYCVLLCLASDCFMMNLRQYRCCITKSMFRKSRLPPSTSPPAVVCVSPQAWTTSSWWNSSRSSSQEARRQDRHRSRAAVHQARDFDGEPNHHHRILGPEAVGQACHGCSGRNHRGLACSRQLCRICCNRLPGGPCRWHHTQATALASVSSR